MLFRIEQTTLFDVSACTKEKAAVEEVGTQVDLLEITQIRQTTFVAICGAHGFMIYNSLSQCSDALTYWNPKHSH